MKSMLTPFQFGYFLLLKMNLSSKLFFYIWSLLILIFFSMVSCNCEEDHMTHSEEMDFLRGLSTEMENLKSRLSVSIKGLEKRSQVQCEAITSLVTTGIIQPHSCQDVLDLGFNTSGIYTVYYQEGNIHRPLRVYCDMETDQGGWLVIQRRRDGHEDFYRDWDQYSQGFGELDNEFWLGNYHIHRLTTQGQFRLRVELEDFEDAKRYATYSNFSVGRPKDKYTLTLSGYSGDAGDKFSGNGMKFSTKDKDYDIYDQSCAVNFKGGWWYSKCHSSNLNGLYHRGKHESYADGVNWSGEWHDYYYSLKTTELKIKPVIN